MELPPPPKRSDVTASRLNLVIGSDSFLVSILEKATTPRKDTWLLNTNENCLDWFYSHIEIQPRPKVDPWDALDIEDFKRVDVSVPAELSCVDLVQDIGPMTPSQAKRKLNTDDDNSNNEQGTPSPSKQAEIQAARKKRRRQWEKKMYPSTYVAPLHDVRVADSINILTALRKLVRRRELHVKMMREAVDLDWWRVISEDWKATVRLLTCEIVELVHVWREKLGPIEGDRPWSPISNLLPRPFLFKGKNYLLKIPTDLDFMTKRSCYGSAQQRNPFLLPFPLEALHEIAAAERDQKSWGCRISRAAAALLDEEKRCGSHVWNEKKRTLTQAPDPSTVQLNAVKLAFHDRARNWGKEEERRGLSHDGSQVSAVRGSTVGTLGTLRSSNGSRGFGGRRIGSRGSGINGGGNSLRGRDIFTPGSNHPDHNSLMMSSPPRTPTLADALSITDTSIWEVSFGEDSKSTTITKNIVSCPTSPSNHNNQHIQQQQQQPQQQQQQQQQQQLLRPIYTPGSITSSIVSDENQLYSSSELSVSRPETRDDGISVSLTTPSTPHRLEPIILARIDQPPTMLSSLQLSPFGSKNEHKNNRTVTLRPKGRWTPKGYDVKNGYDLLTSCPLADCLVCDALRVERKVAVYTAKSDRRQRMGLYNAMMDSRISMLKDMSAAMIQGLWRGALLRMKILRPMYHEEEKVTSDLGGTKMTTWLPNAHATAIRLQKVARVFCSIMELSRRRRAELERRMAVRIQSRYRIRKSQQLVAFRREKKRVLDDQKYLAAVYLQNAFRSNRARRVVHRKLKERRKSDLENNNAATIQRGWRCAMGRYALWLIKAGIACVAIQSSFRRNLAMDKWYTVRELLKSDQTHIKAAHVRLEHLNNAIEKAITREVKGTIDQLFDSLEIKIQKEEEQAAKQKLADIEAAEAIAYEKRTGRKPPVKEVDEVEQKRLKRKKREEEEEKLKLMEPPPDHVLSKMMSEQDVRILTRYLKIRSYLPTPSENKHHDDILENISHFDDRQIVTRLTLNNEKVNKGDDFIALQTVPMLQEQIKEVQQFIQTWRTEAFSSSMRKRVVSRYVGAIGKVPRSVNNDERKQSIAVAIFQHAHIRTYATQNIRDNLGMFRRHLILREQKRSLEKSMKIKCSTLLTNNWIQKGFEKAEIIQREINKKHDRFILDKEEEFIMQEDQHAEKMRSYLTSTKYARVGLWETFSTLFDAKSRRELYIHRNKKDKRKIAELDDNGKKMQKNVRFKKCFVVDSVIFLTLFNLFCSSFFKLFFLLNFFL